MSARARRTRRLVRWSRAGGKMLVALATLGIMACASGGGSSSHRSSTSPLTRDEMGERAALDLYSVVQQLRPNWLRIRGQATPTGGVRQVRVVIDGSLQPGGPDVLRTLRGTQVEELRYLSGQDATTRYGMDVEGGVIVVTTLRG